MTCTWCFWKITPSALEKGCKGEHRQQGGREGEWEFPRGAKGVCMGALLPLGSPEPPPLTLNAHPLRLTQGLAHFGGWGSPCSLCICGRGGSPQPWPWRLSSVPGDGVPGERSLPRLSSSWPVSPAKLGRNLFPELGLFPLKAFYSGASGSTLLIFQEPCEQEAGIYCAAAEHPVVQALLPLFPAPFPFGGHAVIYCAQFLITGTGIKKFWQPRYTNGSLV